jgi:hypothetical protein
MLLSQTETLVNAKSTIFMRGGCINSARECSSSMTTLFFVCDKPAGSWLVTRLDYLRGVDQFPDLKKPRLVASGHPASAVTPFGSLAGIGPGRSGICARHRGAA